MICILHKSPIFLIYLFNVPLFSLNSPVLAAAPDTHIPIYYLRSSYKNFFKGPYFYNMRSLPCFHILLRMLTIIFIVFSYIVLMCVNSNHPVYLLIYLKHTIFLKITCPRCISRQSPNTSLSPINKNFL